MEELLYQYNPWWEEDYKLENIIMRDNYMLFLKGHIETRQIIFLTGLRRVGKTTLMKLLIKELLSKGIESRNILYISVDDYLLKGKSLLDILDEYRKIHRLKIKEKLYVFFDEITYIADYHQQLKNLYDKFDLKIYATSSSSSLLKDKQAYLTGRSYTLEVKPLDFEEYKNFKGINLKKRDDQLNESYFREYIKVGGLPENVLNPNREYLMSLVEDIIQKDITAFHSLKDSQLVRDYFTLLMERSGKQLSINKIANILKISPDTSRRYLGFFEETYLIHLVSRWGKTNEKILSAKKIYACDLGIKHLFVGERDFGSYFENYVYLKLRNQKKIYYLYEDGNEIDFYTSDKIMIESKYNSEMNMKQKDLFERYEANHKLVVDSVSNLKLLENI
ncbi:MAG: ATP-binding protein [Bacteroidetes bacterium]|nr:MAG: ATP-binding protein [Bacteroidota bacterium]